MSQRSARHAWPTRSFSKTTWSMPLCAQMPADREPGLAAADHGDRVARDGSGRFMRRASFILRMHRRVTRAPGVSVKALGSVSIRASWAAAREQRQPYFAFDALARDE